MYSLISRKWIILGGIIFIALFLIIIYFFMSLKSKSSKQPTVPDSTPTPIQDRIVTPSEPAILPEITDYIEEMPDFTGELEITVAPQEANIITQSFELKSKLPIITSDFELNYNYRDDYFTVKLAVNDENNKQIFLNWLNANGYGAIPNEDFVYLQ